VALALLAATAGAVIAGTVLDRQQREVAAVVRHHFTALEQGNLPAALEDLSEAQRDHWRDFLQTLLLNDFAVQDVSVRSPSLLDRWLRGEGLQARSATVFVHINPGTPEAWRATELVPLERRGDRWYLLEPPLKPVASGE
jgi:hypothetical protein